MDSGISMNLSSSITERRGAVRSFRFRVIKLFRRCLYKISRNPTKNVGQVRDHLPDLPMDGSFQIEEYARPGKGKIASRFNGFLSRQLCISSVPIAYFQ